MASGTSDGSRPNWWRPSVLVTAILVGICLILLWQAFTVPDDDEPKPTVNVTTMQTQPTEVWPADTQTTGASGRS